jgi:hypothetical protein
MTVFVLSVQYAPFTEYMQVAGCFTTLAGASKEVFLQTQEQEEPNWEPVYNDDCLSGYCTTMQGLKWEVTLHHLGD